MQCRSLEDAIFIAVHCRSLQDFERKYPGAYNIARRHGWLEDCRRAIANKMTSENSPNIEDLCYSTALLCESQLDWQFRYPKLYLFAKKSGLLKNLIFKPKMP